MHEPAYVYAAEVMRVVDGDTLDVNIDLGFRIFSKQRIRLYGVDTPETYGVKKSSEEYQKGIAAKKAVLDWLHENCDRSASGDWIVVLESHDGQPLGQGKYGRWLAVVWATDKHQDHLNKWLIDNGHAKAVTY